MLFVVEVPTQKIVLVLQRRQVNETRNTPYDLSFLGSSLEDFIGENAAAMHKVVSGYSLFPLPQNTASRMSYKAHSLSNTDIKIVDAAISFANKCNSVHVATSDFGIVEALSRIRDRDNLDFRIISPWNTLTKEEASSLDVKVLIYDRVFHDLVKLDPSGNRPSYLAIATKLCMGPGIEFDIAFGIYTKRLMFKEIPSINGVYFMPLAVIDMKETSQKYIQYYLNFLRFSRYAVYNIPHPSNIGLVEQTYSNPQIQKMLALPQYRQSLAADPETLAKLVEHSFIEWARIKEWHLAIYDRITLGKLNALRERLKKL